MNYVSAVYGVVVLVIVVDWFVRGKKGYRSQTARHEQADFIQAEAAVTVR